MVADASLDNQWHAIRAELFELEEMLGGLNSRQQKGSTPATIGSRLFHAMFGASSTYGPTKTHKEQFGYAMEEYAGVRARLDVFVRETIPAFQKALEAAGAPWTPGAAIPATQ